MRWQISPQALRRTQAALAQNWYRSKPVLRIADVRHDELDGGAGNDSFEQIIPVQLDYEDWFVNVRHVQRLYRVELGFQTEQGRFYLLAKSNTTRTPAASKREQIADRWGPGNGPISKPDEKFPMISRIDDDSRMEVVEAKLRHPMHGGYLREFGAGALPEHHGKKFFFQLDAELLVYGRTLPDSRVSLQGEAITVRPDGSFTVRMSMPEGRQVMPAVAHTPDGLEERTIILGLDRTTRELEPMVYTGDEQ